MRINMKDFRIIQDELHDGGFMTQSGLWKITEEREDEVKEYRVTVEEDPWPGFNQVRTKISISGDGPWKKSKKGCTREECHEGTKKRMSPFLVVMNNFHERGGRYDLEIEVVKRFRLEAESRWRGLFEGVGGSATNGSTSLITL